MYLYNKFFNELLLPVFTASSKILCDHTCYFCFQVFLVPCVLLLVKLWGLACIFGSGNKEIYKSLLSQVGLKPKPKQITCIWRDRKGLVCMCTQERGCGTWSEETSENGEKGWHIWQRIRKLLKLQRWKDFLKWWWPSWTCPWDQHLGSSKCLVSVLCLTAFAIPWIPTTLKSAVHLPHPPRPCQQLLPITWGTSDSPQHTSGLLPSFLLSSVTLRKLWQHKTVNKPLPL